MTEDFKSLFEETEQPEVISEVDSIQTRMKKRRAMRKNKAKIAFARKKAMKRKILDPKKLMKRAQKQARSKIASRILKGKNKSLPFLSEDSFIKEIQSPHVLSPQGSGGKRLSAKLIKSWSKFSTFIDPFIISYHSL